MHQPSSNVFCTFWTPLWTSLGTAIEIRSGWRQSVYDVDSEWSPVCVGGFVLYAVWLVFQMGAGLPNVSMAPKVNASSSRRGAPAVFKSVLHVLDATLDKPGHGNRDPLGPRPKCVR